MWFSWQDLPSMLETQGLLLALHELAVVVHVCKLSSWEREA